MNDKITSSSVISFLFRVIFKHHVLSKEFLIKDFFNVVLRGDILAFLIRTLRVSIVPREQLVLEVF